MRQSANFPKIITEPSNSGSSLPVPAKRLLRGSVYVAAFTAAFCAVSFNSAEVKALVSRPPVHIAKSIEVSRLNPEMRPQVCRDSRGRFASCGSSYSDWVDIVPRLRVPSISVNLGRIIPSVSIGSPVKWGFKVPYSYTPRVKFMKFQVYFNPDFDYFLTKAGWITLATFKAAGNQATVKSQNRAGSQKYRVYSPSGGGYESFTSPTTKKTSKGVTTTGTLTIDPSTMYEGQIPRFSVQLTDKTAPRRVYLLTRQTCDGALPWKSKSGPGSGWNIVGQNLNQSADNSRFTEIAKTTNGGWSASSLEQESSYGYASYFSNSLSVAPVTGITNQGDWSYSSQLNLADNGRCFAAIVPGTGKYKMWVSGPVQVAVNPLISSNLGTTRTNYQISSGNNIDIYGTVSGGMRPITFSWCSDEPTSPDSYITSSAADGSFAISIKGDLRAGDHELCLAVPKSSSHQAARKTLNVAVSRTALSGSVAISTTAINTGQQFTVSGSISPNVADKYVWIRVYCSTDSNYPHGWAEQTYVSPAHSITGRPTGYDSLDYYNYGPITYSITSIKVDANGAFTKTFTSTTPSTCIYGAYVPQTDYHTSWLSDPTPAITVS